MDQSSQIPYTDVLTVQPGDLASGHLDDREQTDGSYVNVTRDKQKNSLDSSCWKSSQRRLPACACSSPYLASSVYFPELV